MDGMTPEQAFRAREMSADGLWSGRIADLLGVEDALVLRALRGESFEPEASRVEGDLWPVEEVDPTPPPPPAPAVAAPAWPPPPDESTEWTTVRVSNGYGRMPTEVRVRWVKLWAQRVRINAQNEVWCHFCLQFKTTEELGHPFNSCPVGLPHRNVIVRYGSDDDVPEPTRYQPVSGDFGASW